MWGVLSFLSWILFAPINTGDIESITIRHEGKLVAVISPSGEVKDGYDVPLGQFKLGWGGLYFIPKEGRTIRNIYNYTQRDRRMAI